MVGGAVRDQLLGLTANGNAANSSTDNDWVVVGATPEEMLRRGFVAVGNDFPVFLHPKTKEEYALARTERKVGHGYTGFACYFDPSVSLEEDLMRRDLTINAIAKNQAGELIDPYGGARDLEQKILRHVSPAFVEDPLRVLRVARFAAKFAPLGFRIADETMLLMQQMVANGELGHLTPERVWQEWHKSLQSAAPEQFLRVLRDCGALAVVLPEIDALFGVPQPEKWHPEIDTGIHTLLVAQQAARLTLSPEIRFTAQVHDLGKGVTPPAEWPSHKRHCQTGLALIRTLCERVRVPNEYRDLALIVCAQHSNIHRAGELRPDTMVKLFDAIDVWRKPERLDGLLLSCEADHAGRLGLEHAPYPQADWVRGAHQAAANVAVSEIVAAGFKGPAIRDELRAQRVQAVAKYLTLIRS
nr:multifunctional CCA addition/repair protein [Vibrio agarilyticus]